MNERYIFEDIESLTKAAAALFIDIAKAAIDERGQFTIALSGGSTPRHLYELLASGKFHESIDWKKVFFFFSDERNVPHSSPESNFRMADETLLSKLPIHQDSVRSWHIWREVPGKIAEDYDMEIRSFFLGDPIFDLILLGLGADCHTASLFPHTPALQEQERFAVANWVEKINDFRFTMTFPLINAAANIIFLVTGDEKAEAVRTVLEGEFNPGDCPAQLVKPQKGHLRWLLDTPAAAKLDPASSFTTFA